MDDELATETTEQETTEPVETPDARGGTPKELRDYADRKDAENKALRKQLRDVAFQQLGLDPETDKGKAIDMTYDGEPTAEAIALFAKDTYGWELSTGGDTTQDVSPLVPVVQAGQAAIDAVAQAATSVGPEESHLEKADALLTDLSDATQVENNAARAISEILDAAMEGELSGE